MCTGLFTSELNTVKAVQDVPEKYVRTLAAKPIYKTNEIIEFKLDQQGFLDPGSVFLLFTVAIDAVAAANQEIPVSGVQPTTFNLSFTNDISNIFSRVRLLFGRTGIVEDIQEYGLLQSLFSLVTDTIEDQVSTESLMNGKSLRAGVAGSNVQNTAFDRVNYHNMSNAGVPLTQPIGNVPRRYKIKVNLGLLTQRKPLPLFLLNDELIIQFTVNKLYNCAYLVNLPVLALPSLTETPILVGVPELIYTIQLPSAIETAMANSALRKRLTYHYPTFVYVNKPLDPFLATQNIKIPLFSKRLLYAIAVIRCENDRSRNVFIQDPNSLYCSLDPRVGRTNTGNNPSNTYQEARNTTLRSYQWFYNNNAIPEKEVSVVEIDLNSTVALSTVTVKDQKTGSAVEALQYLKETLKIRDKVFNISQNDVFGFYDNYILNAGGVISFNQISNLATNNTGNELPYQSLRAFTSNLIMAGKFYSEREGGLLLALDGNSLNANLTLQLNFNNPAKSSVEFPTPPPMSIDIFLACDGMITVDENRAINIDL